MIDKKNNETSENSFCICKNCDSDFREIGIIECNSLGRFDDPEWHKIVENKLFVYLTHPDFQASDIDYFSLCRACEYPSFIGMASPPECTYDEDGNPKDCLSCGEYFEEDEGDWTCVCCLAIEEPKENNTCQPTNINKEAK